MNLRASLIAATAMLAVPAAAQTSADTCAKLASLALPSATVTGAAIFHAHDQILPGTPLLAPADICRITVTARPTPDSDIRIEVWLPADMNKANGKFLQVGNGGFAGQIPYRLLLIGAAQGYAVAGTDDGHQNPNATDASWALGHPEKLVDFGYRALKVTTDIGKALVQAWAQQAPLKSYFFGCSDGGREALMTAQRQPQDFDGIVAGAPAWNWTELQASGALIGARMREPGAALPVAKLPALETAALKACGGGKWIADPKSCKFDPAVIACKGADGDQCLTGGEVATVRQIYRGIKSPATGKHLPGLMPGAEAEPGSWANWGLGSNGGALTTDKPTGFAANWYAYAVRGDAAFRMTAITRADYVAGEKLAPIVNAASPDLSAFRARGGKLIQYHGWNDPAISPGYSLAYHAAVAKKMGDPSGFYRMFMVPGMLHCTGGASPNSIDWLTALSAWVEKGEAPESVTARAGDGATQVVKRER